MLDAKAFANAASAVGAVVFIVCRILVGVMPDGMFRVAQSWMHSVAVTPSMMNGSTSSWLLGIVSMAVVVWLVAYAFASLYNSWAKK